jgi:hypothetical protein
MPHIGVAQSTELAHGLLAYGSGELRTVDHDLLGVGRKKLTRADRNLRQGKAQRSRNVPLSICVTGEYIDEEEGRIVEASLNFFPRTLKAGGQRRRRSRFGYHQD